MMAQKTFEIMDGLFLIDLPQPADGFEKFISAWFFRDNMGKRILIETGPACTIPDLTAELSKITDGVDYILLTHVHLDHSGGLGHLIKKYPGAKVLVSPRGAKHLISPEKLWNASVSTLGDIAERYGVPLPVPSDVFSKEGEAPCGAEIFDTPGHAPHHISFRIPFGQEHLLFAGEAAGMTVAAPAQYTAELYLRPTTPRQFDAHAALSSLELLERVSSADDILCFAHFGSCKNAREVIVKAKEQISLWAEKIRVWYKSGMERRRMIELLLVADPMLAEFKNLPERLQSRELNFIDNSLQGFIGWLES